MKCQGCGNQNAYQTRRVAGEKETCNHCDSFAVHVPDVYFREPYMDPHLIDIKDPKQKDGVWVTSKKHKAELMKKLGVQEAGDKIRGGRNFDKALSQKVNEQMRRK